MNGKTLMFPCDDLQGTSKNHATLELRGRAHTC